MPFNLHSNELLKVANSWLIENLLEFHGRRVIMLRKEIESVILVHEENITEYFKEIKPACDGLEE